MKVFKGFTPEQQHTLLTRMGYQGPADAAEMQKFLEATPQASAKMGQYASKAQKILETPNLQLATGGLVANKRPSEKPKTTEELQKEATEKAARSQAELPSAAGATQTALKDPKHLIEKGAKQQVATNPQQLIDKAAGKQVVPDTATTATVKNISTATVPKTIQTKTYDPKRASEQTRDLANRHQAAQGELTDEAKAGQAVTYDAVTSKEGVDKALDQFQAQTADPTKAATVQGQLEGLMQQFEAGTPPWASGAMRQAMGVMQARGLGASSIAGQAIVQSAMESAIQIAATDAGTYASFEMQNLQNRQETEQFKAGARVNSAMQDSQLETEAARVNAGEQNLNNRQDAAAQAQMEMKNLDNRQQSGIFRTQLKANALLSDQSAINAAKQFNAASENQTQQFMASLKESVSKFNAEQINAMRSFNKGEQNTTRRFNKQIKAARDQFNAQNSLLIAQANAKWRQDIATTEHASNHDRTMTYVKSMNGLTESALDQIWQRERDIMAFAFQGAENENERNIRLLLADKDLASVDKQLKAEERAGLGGIVASVLFGGGGLFG